LSEPVKGIFIDIHDGHGPGRIFHGYGLENRVIQLGFHEIQIGGLENVNAHDQQGDDGSGNQAGPVFIRFS
jgi:hypothetical protein